MTPTILVNSAALFLTGLLGSGLALALLAGGAEGWFTVAAIWATMALLIALDAKAPYERRRWQFQTRGVAFLVACAVCLVALVVCVTRQSPLFE